MFGKRKDGTLVRGLDPIGKAVPYFMPHRYDALNMMQETIDVTEMDAYIKREAKEKGIHTIVETSGFGDSEVLKENGIKTIFFDLDNTLIPYNEELPFESTKG